MTLWGKGPPKMLWSSFSMAMYCWACSLPLKVAWTSSVGLPWGKLNFHFQAVISWRWLSGLEGRHVSISPVSSRTPSGAAPYCPPFTLFLPPEGRNLMETFIEGGVFQGLPLSAPCLAVGLCVCSLLLWGKLLWWWLNKAVTCYPDLSAQCLFLKEKFVLGFLDTG